MDFLGDAPSLLLRLRERARRCFVGELVRPLLFSGAGADDTLPIDHGCATFFDLVENRPIEGVHGRVAVERAGFFFPDFLILTNLSDNDARYFMTNLVVTVFPAPDSPDTRIA